MEGGWSCYNGGQFKGGRMVVMEVVTLMEGGHQRVRGAQFNEGRMVMWPV